MSDSAVVTTDALASTPTARRAGRAGGLALVRGRIAELRRAARPAAG